jgi:hypothetical protein
MNDYYSLLYSEKSVLATDCYDLTPLTYEKRGMLPAKKPLLQGVIVLRQVQLFTPSPHLLIPD